MPEKMDKATRAEKAKRMREAYESGLTIKEVSDKFETSWGLGRTLLLEAGTKLRHHADRKRTPAPPTPRTSRRIEFDVKQMHKDFVAGVSRPALAKKYGVSVATINRRLKVANTDAGLTFLPPPRVHYERADQLNIGRSEMAILSRIAQGFTNKAIGDALGFNEGQVANHLKEIFPALGAIDRATAMRQCYEMGLLSRPANNAASADDDPLEPGKER